PEDGVLGTRQQRAHGVQRARGENFMAMVHHRNADRCPANHTTCPCHQPTAAADGGEGVKGEDAQHEAAQDTAGGCAEDVKDAATAASESAESNGAANPNDATAAGNASAAPADGGSKCARV